MPPGLLTCILVLGAAVAAALWPPRLRPLAMAAYLLGVVVNEIPQYAALLLAVALGTAIASGDIASAVDALVIAGLAALVAAGLFAIGWRARHARAVVAAALDDAGIAPVRSAAGDASTGDGRMRPGWLTALAPFPVRPRTVVRHRGLAYGPAPRQRLDVYHHAERPPGHPALLYLHGGGYFSGGKHREARALLHRLAEHGWVCVSANYRLRPRAGFLDHLADAKRALAWTHEHAADYGADGARVVLAGSSAGAHLALLTGLSQGDRNLQPGFESADTSVAAVVALYGYYDRYYGRGPDEAVPSTPLAMDASAAPPCFVAHGTRDNLVAVERARALVAKLRAGAPQRPVYVELPGAQHGFDLLCSWRFDAVIDGVEDFAASTIAAPAGTR